MEIFFYVADADRTFFLNEKLVFAMIAFLRECGFESSISSQSPVIVLQWYKQKRYSNHLAPSGIDPKY